MNSQGEELRRYQGAWKAGKQHGYGKFTKDGKSRDGEWNMGKRVKWTS